MSPHLHASAPSYVHAEREQDTIPISAAQRGRRRRDVRAGVTTPEVMMAARVFPVDDQREHMLA